MVKRKGGKKQVLHLSEFLGDAAQLTPTAVPTYTDECSTDLSLPAPAYYSSSEPRVDLSSLPSAPRAQREGSFDPSKVPRYPPFTAYVGNLPFDSEDEDITKMFQKNTVKEVRLLKDKDTGHFKGFGYVEFETADGLIEALKINEKMVRGRAIKVDVATTAGQTGGSSGDRWERGRTNSQGEREPYVDTTSDDWRRDSKPQEDSEGGPPPYEIREYRPRRFEGGSEDRSEDRPPRRNYNDSGNDSFSRDDFGTKMNEAAKEPYKPASRFRDEHDDRGERPSRGAWGTSSAPRENAWATRDAPREPENSWVRHGELPAEDDEGDTKERDAKERPRLNLKPRSAATTDQAQPKPVSKSNPFGNAKPVDIPEKPEKVSVADTEQAQPKPVSKSNPFGNAKPVDIPEKPEKISEADPEQAQPKLSPKWERRSAAATDQAQPKPVSKSNPFGNAKPVDIPEKPEKMSEADTEQAQPKPVTKWERRSVADTEKLRSEPEGREIENKKTSPKANPFGSAKPADTASWRSNRVQGTGPIKAPQEHTKEGKEIEDDIIVDSNKFMVLNEDED